MKVRSIDGSMRDMSVIICCLAIGLLTCAPATAGVIQSVTSGAGFITDNFYLGQSFTTPVGGPWSGITFNFFSDANPAITPYAIGTAYLFNQVFAGTPATLSSAAPGFIAADTSIVGNKYVFGPSVILQPGTQYFLYSDAFFLTNSISGAGGGTALYAAAYPNSSFGQEPVTLNFALGGTAVPEPGGISLVSIGVLAGFCRFVRRKVS